MVSWLRLDNHTGFWRLTRFDDSPACSSLLFMASSRMKMRDRNITPFEE
jgi:hypothetical protein